MTLVLYPVHYTMYTEYSCENHPVQCSCNPNYFWQEALLDFAPHFLVQSNCELLLEAVGHYGNCDVMWVIYLHQTTQLNSSTLLCLRQTRVIYMPSCKVEV